jgi:hypothetical protein
MRDPLDLVQRPTHTFKFDSNTIPVEMRNAKRWLVHRDKKPFYTNGNPRSGQWER